MKTRPANACPACWEESGGKIVNALRLVNIGLPAHATYHNVDENMIWNQFSEGAFEARSDHHDMYYSYLECSEMHGYEVIHPTVETVAIGKQISGVSIVCNYLD